MALCKRSMHRQTSLARKGVRACLQAHANAGAFFWAEQGRVMLELLSTNFDKVSAHVHAHAWRTPTLHSSASPPALPHAQQQDAPCPHQSQALPSGYLYITTYHRAVTPALSNGSAHSHMQIEASTLLHSHLIDQNRFSYMLEALDCQADRDNVWHRITMLKKSTSRAVRTNSVTAAQAPHH